VGLTAAGRRLFVAVDVPAAQRERLEKAVASAALDPDALRLVAPEHRHITLAFYGDVTGDSESELATKLERAAARTPAFTIQLDHAGAFPADPRRARVIWIGVRGDVEVMSRLSDRCRAAGRHSGLTMPRERFRPHLTVARSRRGPADVDAALARLWDFRSEPWSVTSFHLIHSTLGATVRHEPVREFRLLD
jgi:2'-5' RNA ligase